MISPSNRIVSLWDMLEKLDAERLVQSVAYLSSCSKRYQALHTKLTQNAEFNPNFNEEADLNLPKCFATVIEGIANQLGMFGVSCSAVHLKQKLHDYGLKSAPADRALIYEIQSAIDTLVVSFGNELAGRKLFVMGPKYGDYYSPAGPLFGGAVDIAFPLAAPEVEEAGRCIALGRWTGAVMHLMRALEPALLAFQSAVEVKTPKINWQEILDQIDAKIKVNGHKHPDHVWNSEASLQFLRFKDAWRNYAMHGKERYDEERAISIYEGVRAFMRHLASRLHG